MSVWTAPQELHDLAFRYALAVDNCDAGVLAEIFTEDGVVRGMMENPIHYQGRAGLETMCSQLVSAFHSTMHNVYNQTFEKADDGTVTGITYCIASHIIAGEDWKLLDMALLYHNRYAQNGEGWKFADRSLEVLWVETRPVQKFGASMMDNDLKDFR